METKSDRRLRKLRQLADQHGGLRAIADKAKVSAASLDQIVKGVPLPPKKDGSRSPRSLGDSAAHAIEDAFQLGRGWFDSETPPSGGVPALPHGADTHVLTDTSGNRLRRAGDIELPRLDVQASMGLGLHVPEHDEVVATMTVDRSWLRRSASFTALENLVLITGYGDSMKGTFEDGDILLVDKGVHEVKIDGVYVLALNDELYIKRLQRKPDGSVLMISDNDRYEPYLIQNGEKDRFAVKGRVVLAWNAKRL